MKNLILTIFIFVAGFSIQPLTSFAQTIAERLARATAATDKNDFDGAMPDIEEVLKAQPDNAVGLNLRGIVYFNRKNYDQAIADCSRAITINPQYAHAYAIRAMAINRKTNPDYKSGIADLSRAIEILPNYGSAYNERGWANEMIGNWNAAESDFTQAIKYGANNKEIYVNRGVARFNSSNYDYAAMDYRKSLEIDPNYALARTNLTQVKAIQQKVAAQFHMPRLIAALPNGVDAGKFADSLKRAADFINAADANESNFSEAVKILKDVHKTEPKNPAAFYLEGIMMYKLRFFDYAYVDATGAIEANPKAAEFYYLRGLSRRYDPNLWRLQDQRTSFSDFNKAIELNPNFSDAYRESGSAKYYLFRLSSDFTVQPNPPGQSYTFDLNDAVRLNPKDGEAYFVIGISWLFFKAWEDVESNLTKAINLGINRSEVYENRGYANFKLKNRAQAIADYQKAVELDPDNATAKENLNRLNANQKKMDLLVGTTAPPVDSWTARMRELGKKYEEEVANATWWAQRGSTTDQQQNCRALGGWWAGTHNGGELLVQLAALSHRAGEREVLIELIATLAVTEKNALAQWQSNKCTR